MVPRSTQGGCGPVSWPVKAMEDGRLGPREAIMIHVKSIVLSFLGLCALAAGASAAAAPGESAPVESTAMRDARMQWWREARFGMFVHWGLYSGLAGTWDGKPVGTRGGMEWIQQRVKADTDTYARPADPAVQAQARFRHATGPASPSRPAAATSSSPPSTTTASPCTIRRSATTTPARCSTAIWSRKSSTRCARRGSAGGLLSLGHRLAPRPIRLSARPSSCPIRSTASRIPTASATTPSTSITCTRRSTNWSPTTARWTSSGGTTVPRISRATRPGAPSDLMAHGPRQTARRSS